MKKLILALLLTLLAGCQNLPNNTIADGNVTIEESRKMQQGWCEFNKDQEFAKDQCKDIK